MLLVSRWRDFEMSMGDDAPLHWLHLSMTARMEYRLGCMHWVHNDATWRIRWNRPCAAAMRPYVNILLLLVITGHRALIYLDVDRIYEHRPKPLCQPRLIIFYFRFKGVSGDSSLDAKIKLSNNMNIQITYRYKIQIQDISLYLQLLFYMNLILERYTLYTVPEVEWSGNSNSFKYNISPQKYKPFNHTNYYLFNTDTLQVSTKYMT